jgi:proteasome lid subunit RPN8/RPN11
VTNFYIRGKTMQIVSDTKVLASEGYPERGKLFLSTKALSKILSLLKRMNGTEFGFKLIGKPLGKASIYVGNIFVPQQIVNSASFEVTESGYVEMAKLKNSENYGIVGWGHSHAYMSAFHSGTDLKTDASHMLAGRLPFASLVVCNHLTGWQCYIYFKIKDKRIGQVKAEIVFPHEQSAKKIVGVCAKCKYYYKNINKCRVHPEWSVSSEFSCENFEEGQLEFLEVIRRYLDYVA